jgi:hypothetical protein
MNGILDGGKKGEAYSPEPKISINPFFLQSNNSWRMGDTLRKDIEHFPFSGTHRCFALQSLALAP